MTDPPQEYVSLCWRAKWFKIRELQPASPISTRTERRSSSLVHEVILYNSVGTLTLALAPAAALNAVRGEPRSRQFELGKGLESAQRGQFEKSVREGGKHAELVDEPELG